MSGLKPAVTLSQAYGDLTRAWCGELPFQFREQEHTLQLKDQRIWKEYIAFQYGWQDKVVCLLGSLNGLCTCLDPNLKGVDPKAYGSEIYDLLLKAMQEELGEIFLQFEERLEPQEVHYTTAPINAICFTLNNAGKPIYQLGINGQDAVSCQLMRAIADKTKPSELKFRQLKFPFRQINGQAQLSWEELRSLRVGDVILSQTSPAVIKFYWQKILFWGELKETTFCIKGLFMEENNNDLPVGIISEDEADASDETTNAEPISDEQLSDASAFPVDQLPVTISFDVGQKQLTFDQLQQLHEGYTFELDKKVDASVSVLANGQCIGQGEWVQVNDKLGVRMTHLYTK